MKPSEILRATFSEWTYSEWAFLGFVVFLGYVSTFSPSFEVRDPHNKC